MPKKMSIETRLGWFETDTFHRNQVSLEWTWLSQFSCSLSLVKRLPRQSRRLSSYPKIRSAFRQAQSLPKRSHLTHIPLEIFVTYNLGLSFLGTGGYTDLGDAQGTEVFWGWWGFIFHVFCCLIHTWLWLGHERGETGEELKGQIA